MCIRTQESRSHGTRELPRKLGVVFTMLILYKEGFFQSIMGKSKRIGIYLPIFLTFLLATVTIRCIALLCDFDFSSGYFTRKALISVSDYMLIGVCFLFFTYIIIARRGMKVRYELSSPRGYVASAILECAVLFLGISMLISYAGRGLAPSLNALLLQPMAIIEILLFILSLPASAYLVIASTDTRRISTVRAGLGLCTVIFFATYAAYLYFEASLPINAPNKLVDQMSYLFASLFLLFETRISLDRQTPRAYVAMGLISASLAAYSSIPSVIVFLVSGQSVSNSIYDVALSLAFCIYVILRLISFDDAKSYEESSIVAIIRESADNTEASLNAKEEKEKLEYIKALNRIAKAEYDAKIEDIMKNSAESDGTADVGCDAEEDGSEEVSVEAVEYSLVTQDDENGIIPADTTSDV